METLKDLAGVAKAADGTVIDAPGRTAPYSYDEFGTNCYKAGNLLGHYGAHPGGAVVVLPGPKAEPAAGAPETIPDSADPFLAIVGGASVGATVDLTPTTPVAARALVRPDWQDVPVEPGCSVLAYGGPPTEPSVTHFEQELWSENPTAPPEQIDPTDPAVRIDEATFTHEQVLDAAEGVVERHGIDETSRVLLRTGLADPGALVGVLAVLVVGGTVLLPTGADGEVEPTLVVDTAQDGGVPTLVTGDVTERLRGTDRA